jgi:glycine/serine hydroxymethyltransferase
LQDVLYDLEERINNSVFPGLQGGPHEHQIAAISVALHEAMQPSFVEYQKQVLKNATAFASEIVKRGFKLTTGGTDNHLMVVDLKVQCFALFSFSQPRTSFLSILLSHSFITLKASHSLNLAPLFSRFSSLTHSSL